MLNFLIFLVCVAVGVVRFYIPTRPLSPEGAYQAFAHLLVGGLFGAYLVSKRGMYLWLMIGLTIVELVAVFLKFV